MEVNLLMVGVLSCVFLFGIFLLLLIGLVYLLVTDLQNKGSMGHFELFPGPMMPGQHHSRKDVDHHGKYL